MFYFCLLLHAAFVHSSLASPSDSLSLRQSYIDACRLTRNVFKGVRERAFKICAFARELKSQTHCAFPFKSVVNMKIVVERLNTLGFVQVNGSTIPNIARRRFHRFLHVKTCTAVRGVLRNGTRVSSRERHRDKIPLQVLAQCPNRPRSTLYI